MDLKIIFFDTHHLQTTPITQSSDSITSYQQISLQNSILNLFVESINKTN